MNQLGWRPFTVRERMPEFDLTPLPAPLQHVVAPFFSYFNVAEDDAEHLTQKVNQALFVANKPDCFVGLPMADGTMRCFWLIRAERRTVLVKLGPTDGMALH